MLLVDLLFMIDWAKKESFILVNLPCIHYLGIRKLQFKLIDSTQKKHDAEENAWLEKRAIFLTSLQKIQL